VLAVIVVVPIATPVMGTVVVVVFAATTTEAGALTMLGGFALIFTVTPVAGAGAERVTVKFDVRVPVMVRVGGVRAIDPVLWTTVLAGA